MEDVRPVGAILATTLLATNDKDALSVIRACLLRGAHYDLTIAVLIAGDRHSFR